MEAKDELCAVIETVAALKEKFKADHIVDVMRGKRTADVRNLGHDELELFGCTEKSDQKFLSAVIRQAVIAGYLERDIENYGLLKLTPKAKKFLNKPESFKIVEDREFNEEEEVEVLKSGAGCAADPELYSILKDLRKKIARQNSLPPYVIFQDPSLEAMATTYPVNIEELAGIAGVGAGKARRYGKEFVEVIRRHVEENDIDRPEDLVVRSLANKSKVKISIIHAIDRKIDLNEIADSKGMEFDELLDEIESIVNSGTKININYYIDEMLDEDQQDEIFDWFKQSESGMLEEAYQELGSDYSEEEIRLMRIKFISDMGY